MRLVAFLLRASWRIVVLAVIAGAISGGSNAGLIALINATLNSASPSPTLLVEGFVGLAFVAFISMFTSRVLLVRLAQGAILNLRMRLSRRILGTPLRSLEEIGPHRLLANLTDDVLIITEALRFIPVIAINGLTIAISLAYLGWLSGVTLLALLSFIVLGVFAYQLLAARALRWLRMAREEEDSLFQHFRSLTEGIKELKIHRQRGDAFLSQALQPTARTYRDYSVNGMTRFTIAEIWGQLVFFSFVGLLLFAMPRLIPMSTRVLTGSTLVVLYTLAPLQAVVGALPIMGRATISLRKIERLGLTLDDQPDERGPAPQAPPDPSWRGVELVGVSHSYHREREDSHFILGPLDLAFRPGELVFLVGGNGSGKTTFAKLLIGLYTPESGEIRVDGRPVTDETREAYRQYFSVVFSDFHLFESLLGLGSPELDAQARDFLVQLQLDHKVQVNEGVLSTLALSQGQRKRLALLTAYLEDRPFYVFDEWASDQDPLFKEVFYTQLLPNLKARGKAILVITHDEKYFHLADRIVKLDYGTIEQDGPVVSQPLGYGTHTYTGEKLVQDGKM